MRQQAHSRRPAGIISCLKVPESVSCTHVHMHM